MTVWLKELFNITHTFLIVPPIKTDGKTPGEFPSGSLLDNLRHKKRVGRKQKFFDRFYVKVALISLLLVLGHSKLYNTRF